MRIHHITAIAGAPQANVDFYTGVLGLRLVKRTVNFDDPGTWHLYYGDGVGTPGTIMTFFAWAGLPPLVRAQARPGAGQIDAVAFRIPAGSAGWWQDRLAALAVDFDVAPDRFGDAVLSLADPDGIRVELVAGGAAGAPVPWAGGGIPGGHAITGLHGVTTVVHDTGGTADLLAGVLGFRAGGVEGARHRYTGGAAALPAVFDMLVQPAAAPGRMGIGATHHIAWRATDRAEQASWRAALEGAGHAVTPVMDRKYFDSIYFREPAGVVFEIATDGPGFLVDEAASSLGSGLMLPPWLEPRRDRIEARLPSFTVRDTAAAPG